MEICNMASFPIMVVFANPDMGFSEENTVGHHQQKFIANPFFHGLGKFFFNIPGTILVQEYGDPEKFNVISQGKPLIMKNGPVTLIIRHNEDPPVTFGDLGWD